MECFALALNDQAISRPYGHRVRGPGTATPNILDLGPLHDDVKTHLQALIDNLELLLSRDSGYILGALETFQRFTPEFAPDGLVAISTQAERDIAHMPARNNANDVLIPSEATT